MGRALLVLASLLVLLAPVVPAWAEDGPIPPENARLPVVTGLAVEQAVQVLRRAGFVPGRVYEIVSPNYLVGTVVQQRPDPERLSNGYARGFPVDLRVSARQVGPAEGRPFVEPSGATAERLAPSGPATGEGRRPVDATPPRAAAPSPPARTEPAAEAAVPAPATVDPEPSAVPPPAALEPEVPASVPVEPSSAQPAPAAGVGQEPRPAPPGDEAVGSPDAPREASIRTDEVPSLVGLALVDAEGLARRAGIAIYVERVAGHPIGRVLTQEPVAGSARTPGDVVKVRVTAGGDAPGQAPPPPSVGVRDVIVPDVLDRQPLQARRILEDMGLVVTEEEATSGPPGRVVDQIPSVGDVVPKGTVVRIRVTPVAAPIVRPPAPSPSAPAPEVRTPAAPPVYEPTPVPPAAAPVPPQGAAPEPCVLPARLVAPYPISPSAGTELPGDRLVPVGFTWKAVGGADGYVLEVEEKGTDAWLPSVRRPVRSTAAMLEVERLSSSPGALRWRVRAVAGGREGPPCPWVVLR